MAKRAKGEFAPYLEDVLHNAGVATTTPIVVCGMAGARGGWHEVPYAKAPARDADIAARAATVHAGRYRCKILPGVSLSTEGRFDVMRGEETLLFGALTLGAGDGLYCLPGTHSKWCRIKNGVLSDWQTVMTGELFALLSTQSTLAGFCDAATARLHEKPEFSDAVREVLDGRRSALHDLFAIRARALLDPAAETLDFAARLSGLLIGQEIAGRALQDARAVTLIASGAIGDAYRQALGIAGITVKTLDAEQTALAGLNLLAQALFEDGGWAEQTA